MYMFKLILASFWVVAQLSAITVSGTVYNADSSVAKGVVTISWPTFNCSGSLVMAGSKTLKLNNGALSVSLCSLDYYTVTYRLEGATTSVVAWVVPSSPASVTILDVQQVIPPAGLPASGILQINSQTGSSQSIAAGTSGNSFNVSSSGNTHTINCPTASATKSGCLSSADWSTFNAGLGTNGTVTSVALTAPAMFSVAGSPITTSGTLALTLANQTANTYLAGPTTGSPAAPAFRNIVSSDLPALPGELIATGTINPARILTGSVTNSRCVHVDSSGNLAVTGSDCGAGGGSGNVVGSGTPIVGQIPYYTDTSGLAIAPGYTPSIAAVGTTLVYRHSSGAIYANGIEGYGGPSVLSETVIGPALSDTPTLILRRYSSSQTNNLVNIQGEGGFPLLAAIDKNGQYLGNSTTSTYSATTGALNADPTNCGAGFAPRGIAADGTVQDCFAPTALIPTVYCTSMPTDGTTDASFALQTCINSLPDTGGIVDVGGYSYAIASTVELGNGSITAAGTRFGVTLRGQGRGSDAHVTGDADGQQGATRFKWTGSSLSTKNIASISNTTPVQLTVTSHGFTDHQMYVLVDQAGRSGSCSNDNGANGVFQIRIVDANTLELRGSTGNGTFNASCPGTLYYGSPILRVAGPTLNIRVEGIHFDGGATNSGSLTGTLSTSVPTAFTGIEMRHASNSSLKDVSVTRTAGLGLLFRTSNIAPINYGNCHGYAIGVDYLLPQHQRSSGMAMTGYDASSGMDTCSWKFSDIKMAYGGGGGSFGVEEAFADNNSFHHLQLPKSTAGTGVDWRSTRQVTQTAFPQAQVCDRCYIATYGGTTGTGGGGKFLWLPNYGSQEIGGVIPSTLTASSDVRGYNDMGQMWNMSAYNGFTVNNGLINIYNSTNEDYADVTINHSSGAQNGSGNIYFQRAGTNIARIKTHYFDGMGLYIHDGGGTGTLLERLRLRPNGIMTPSTVNFSDLGGEPSGSFASCANCQVTSGADNTCTSGGSGALAVKINGTWRCFATQN